MIKRLKYLSRQSHPMARSEIDEIVNCSRVRNAKLGITGALVATGNVLFQIIEGPAAAIDALFTVIAADKRHRDVVCLGSQGDCAERIFPKWSMNRITLENSPEAATAEAMLRRLATATPEDAAALSEELSRMMAAQLLAA